MVMDIEIDNGWQSECILLRELGNGRFGTADLIRKGDRCMVRHVIYRVTNIEDKWQRLRALQLSSHPNLEELVRVFVTPQNVTIYTEHYGDLTLLDFIRGYFEPMIPEPQVLRWMCHILDGLQFLHIHGQQHGNLSARNVLLVPGHPKLLRLTNWTMAMFTQRTDARTDLECLGSILLVLITLNSALDGRTLPQDTLTSLLRGAQTYFSDFLLNITHDLITNSMESVSYLRGLMATPDDSLYGSQPDMPSLEGDQISQVDASPIHRRERARILHQLAEEAARASRGSVPKHPSMIITFFNLFKMSVKSWKRMLKRMPFASDLLEDDFRRSEWYAGHSGKSYGRKLVRSISCPVLFFRRSTDLREVNVIQTVTG